MIEFLIFSYTMKGRKEMNIMNSLCIEKVMMAFMLGFPVLYSQAEEPAVMPVLPDTIAAPHTVKSEGTVQVAFSPRGGGQDIINNALHEADRSIMVQAYLFSNKSIAAQLEAASQRGVSVQVILDSSQEKKTNHLVEKLISEGIQVRVDHDFHVAHNKIMIVDRKTVVTGSFNYTYASENRNAENVLVIRGNQKLANLYVDNWEWCWNHSQRWNPQ